MARKIKFALKMPGDVFVRTIEELKQNFDLASVLEYYFNGKLTEWLLDRRHNEYANAISALDNGKADFKQELCKVFGVDYQEIENVAVEEVAELIGKRQILKEFTDDETILEKADEVIFEQQELNELLKDDKEQIIYLFGKEFTIPVKYKNKKYVGVNNPKIKMLPIEVDRMRVANIQFKDVVLIGKLKDEYEAIKSSVCLESELHSLGGVITKKNQVLMMKMSSFHSVREGISKYGEKFIIYRHKNANIYPTYDKYRYNRDGLMINYGNIEVDPFGICDYQFSNPVFFVDKYIYYLERFSSRRNSGDLVRFDIENQSISRIKEGVSRFAICDDKIIYFYHIEKTRRDGWSTEVYYDVVLNNLDFSDEIFLLRASTDYDFKIVNQSIDTVYHEYASFKWHNKPVKINGLKVEIVDIDILIETFSSMANSYVWALYNAIESPLEKKGLQIDDCIEVDDIEDKIMRNLYADFLEGKIVVKGENEYRHQVDILLREVEIIENNSVVMNMIDDNGKCDINAFLEWLKNHNIKVDKRLFDVLKSNC